MNAQHVTDTSRHDSGIATMLHGIVDALAALPDSASKRALLLEARSYLRVLESGQWCPPPRGKTDVLVNNTRELYLAVSQAVERARSEQDEPPAASEMRPRGARATRPMVRRA
jgi:hypothetical protein